MSTLRTLVRRDLARLSADRVTLIVIALASVAALLGALFTSMAVSNAPGGSSGLGARVRMAAWENGTGLFNMLIFVLAIQLGATHVSSDMKSGTLFSWLARPLSRAKWIAASWIAGSVLLLGLEAARSGVIFVACWWIDGHPPWEMLAGALAHASEPLLLFTLVFTVASAAPAPYAVALGIASYLLGGMAWQGVLRGMAEPGIVEGVATVVPLFARHDRLVRAALLGEGTGAAELWWVLAYRGGWSILLVALAALIFSRRELSPRG